MSSNKVSNNDRDPIYAWVMVFTAFTLSALSFGQLSAISVFLKPLSNEFDWSRGETSLAYTLTSFSSAIFGVLWGFLADKYGTRWYGVIGSLFMALALYLLSRQSTLTEFYVCYFLFGAFGNAIVTSPLFANVGFWFRKNPGLALGITASGGAVGQGIVPFLAGLGITHYGWQQTYVIMASSYLIISLPVAFLVRESPRRERARVTPEVEVLDSPVSEREAVTWICVAVIFCCNCMAVPIVHLVPLLTDAGRSMETATSVLMVLMFAGALGRIMGGKLGDIIGALPAYMLMSLGQTMFVYWFPLVDGLTPLYALAVCFGFTYSGVMSCILVVTRNMVTASFGARAMSIVYFFGWFGMGMGGFLGGYLFDYSGNYQLSFQVATFMGVINLIILSMFYFRVRSQR
jgi:MFS family permease